VALANAIVNGGAVHIHIRRCERPVKAIPREQLMTTPDDYTVRRSTPADAEGVVALVRQVYGNRYTCHEEIYDPRQVARMNETGQLISIIALDPAGTVVGHCAMLRPDLGPIAETGETMVASEHRAHHLMDRMQALVHDEATRLGLTGLYGEPVTSHLLSQKVYETHGAHACGVLLGMLPASFQNLPQRMTDMMYFRFLRPPLPTVAHLPDRHRAIGERIYAQFSAPVEFRSGVPLTGEGQLVSTYRSVTQSGTIQVKKAGANVPSEIRRCRQALADSGAEVVYLDLSLAQPQTPELCRAAEVEGFFFAALMPLMAPDGDFLRLQFLGVKLDPALLQIENVFARELLEYVVQDGRRVGAPLGAGHAGA
jgi:hypothetical protein